MRWFIEDPAEAVGQADIQCMYSDLQKVRKS